MKVTAISFGFFQHDRWMDWNNPGPAKKFREFLEKQDALKIADSNYGGTWGGLSYQSKFEAEFADTSLSFNALVKSIEEAGFRQWGVVPGFRVQVEDDKGKVCSYSFVSRFTPQRCKMAIYKDNAEVTTINLGAKVFPPKYLASEIKLVLEQFRERIVEMVQIGMTPYIAEAEARAKAIRDLNVSIVDLLLQRKVEQQVKSIWD